MLLTVLIPIFQLDNYRKRNLEFIYNRLIDHYDTSSIEIIFSIGDEALDIYFQKFDRAVIKHYPSKTFNKSYLFNQTVKEPISGDFLVFLDVDVYLPFHKLATQLTKNDEIVRPFNECIFLDEDTTQNFLINRQAVASKELRRLSATGACCLILRSSLLKDPDVRMDEGFTGWGWEDIDFANSLSKKFLVKVINQPAVHLYHPPASPNNANVEYYKKKHQYFHKPYYKCHKQDIGIIIAYFSPCNFQQPRKNLYRMIDSLISMNCPITIVEATMPGADRLTLPESIQHIRYDAGIENTLFLKENLYNLGIQHTNYNKNLFLDGDILFNNPNFINECSSLLDEYDIIQPFDICMWMNKNDLPLGGYTYKHSMCKGILLNKIINGISYHPGFAWGLTRDFIDYCGGFYDQHPVGGADIAFNYAICPSENKAFINTLKYLRNTNNFFYETEVYLKYREKVQAFNPKIGYLKNCICYHMYHGSHNDRNYNNRCKEYLPALINNNYPIRYDSNGLLQWIDKNNAIKCLYYFKNRKEDD